MSKEKLINNLAHMLANTFVTAIVIMPADLWLNAPGWAVWMAGCGMYITMNTIDSVVVKVENLAARPIHLEATSADPSKLADMIALQHKEV